LYNNAQSKDCCETKDTLQQTVRQQSALKATYPSCSNTVAKNSQAAVSTKGDTFVLFKLDIVLLTSSLLASFFNRLRKAALSTKKSWFRRSIVSRSPNKPLP
jgi:hypothetical protein